MKLCCIVNPMAVCQNCKDQVCEDCDATGWHWRRDSKGQVNPAIDSLRYCPLNPELPMQWDRDRVHPFLLRELSR